ncbi:MAG: VCBS repeat-containing protein [bacterium]
MNIVFKCTKIFLSVFAFAISLLVSPAPAVSGELQPIEFNNPGLVVDLAVGLWAWPLIMDFDNDGDLDLIVSCPDTPYNGAYFFENSDDKSLMPVFEPGEWFGNGLKNLRASYTDSGVRVTDSSYEYTDFIKKGFNAPVPFPISHGLHKDLLGIGRHIRDSQWSYADLNGDGRPDLVVGLDDWTDYGWDNAYDANGRWTKGPLRGSVFVALNASKSAKPKYGKPFRLSAGGAPIDVYGTPAPIFADFDGDGDLDLVCGEFLDRLTYFENIGSRERPEYAKGRFLSYKGQIIRMDLEMIAPAAADWNHDGRQDLIVAQEDGRVALIENSGRVDDGMPVFLPPRFFRQKAYLVKFGALATPVGFDWDGDGREDLISGNSAGYIGFIRNLGGGETPKWAEPVLLEANGKIIRVQAGENGSIQGPAEAKWGYTTISVADWNGDGLPDILANSILGEVVWFQNIGTRKIPKLKAAQPVGVNWPGAAPKPEWNWKKTKGKQLITQWRTTPFAIDFNRDGLTDLIMLDHEGYLAFFERARKNGKLILKPGSRIFIHKNGAPLRLNDKKAGKSGRRKICVVDWDGDGRLDLLADSENVAFYRNMGTRDGKIILENMGNLSNRRLTGHDTSPTVVHWRGKNKHDLLLGAEDGHFYFMKHD